MTNKDKKIQRTAKCLAFFGVAAFLSLAFRLWPVFILALFLSAATGIRYAYLTKRETEHSNEPVRAQKEMGKSDIQEKECLQNFVTESVNKLMADECSDEDWLWEYPDFVDRLEKGKDVCIILFGTNGFRKAKVVFSEYIATVLEFVEESAEEPTENNVQAQPGADLPAVAADYGLIAFEWVDSHITELNGTCNDAIGRGEKELTLAPDELPVRESWNALCDELVGAGIHSADCRENGIVIRLS